MHDETIQHALAYHRRGFTVMPLTGKRPILKGWTSLFHLQPLTEQEIQFGITNENGQRISFAHKNLGILTGRISNCIVIDIDDEEALKRLESLGPLPRSWTVKTNRGYHFYYMYHPDAPSCTPFEKVDILSDKKQVVAPPSIHPSGHKYKWVISPNDAELAPFPEWLIPYMEKKRSCQIASTEKKSPSKKTLSPLYKKMGRKKSLDAEMVIQTVDWFEFYGRFVENIKGNGEWLSATCPFHDDEHNSFSFHIHTGGWTCFAGCGSGNGIQAVQRLYKVSFHQALKIARGEDVYV
ncbi:bifunctional DNA primase/polymerase [Bacillus sp. FJAT-42315]|uniref:bifunctional DNA primase/polymerase n=2 Tax=Bacillus sp. FJAT-42315 TaxID=2014077 RepID=UPI000C238199|nr:bifunctional DNA primase/polymerase [Bacillus sp. FJAT-42315]